MVSRFTPGCNLGDAEEQLRQHANAVGIGCSDLRRFETKDGTLQRAIIFSEKARTMPRVGGSNRAGTSTFPPSRLRDLRKCRQPQQYYSPTAITGGLLMSLKFKKRLHCHISESNSLT